jgi:hypothetical protein
VYRSMPEGAGLCTRGKGQLFLKVAGVRDAAQGGTEMQREAPWCAGRPAPHPETALRLAWGHHQRGAIGIRGEGNEPSLSDKNCLRNPRSAKIRAIFGGDVNTYFTMTCYPFSGRTAIIQNI